MKSKSEVVVVQRNVKNSTVRLPTTTTSSSQRKLSYNEQRELDGLPARIDALEKEIAAIEQDLVSGKIYTSDRLAPAQEELEELVDRWAELEERRM